MSIRFLHAWGGYTPGQRVTLEGATETTLIASGIAKADVGRDDAPSTALTITTSITLTAEHTHRRLTADSPTPITLTLATDAAGGFSGDEWFDLCNAGAGLVTIAAPAGGTLRNAATLAQHKATLIERRGANTWAMP